MNCYKCGQTITDQSEVCPVCGTDLKIFLGHNLATEATEAEKSEKNFRISFVLIPLVLICCIGIGIIIFYLFHPKTGMVGKWSLQTINGESLEKIVEEGNKEEKEKSGEEHSVEEIALNMEITNGGSILITTADADVYMEYEYKMEDGVMKIQEKNDSDSDMYIFAKMNFKYDEEADTITMTRDESSGEMVWSRGARDLSAASGKTIYTSPSKMKERSRELADLQTLDMIYNAFTSTIASLGIVDPYDGVGLTPELKAEFENLVGKSLEDIEGKFSSKTCKGKKVYFYYNGSGEVRVSIGSREGVKSEESGQVFSVSD